MGLGGENILIRRGKIRKFDKVQKGLTQYEPRHEKTDFLHM